MPHVHPFSSIFIHFHPCSSIFIHFHPFSSISISLRGYISIVGWRTFSNACHRRSRHLRARRPGRLIQILAITMRPNMAQQLPTMLRLRLRWQSQNTNIAIILLNILILESFAALGVTQFTCTSDQNAALSSTLHSNSPVVRTWGGRDSRLKLKSNHII